MTEQEDDFLTRVLKAEEAGRDMAAKLFAQAALGITYVDNDEAPADVARLENEIRKTCADFIEPLVPIFERLRYLGYQIVQHSTPTLTTLSDSDPEVLAYRQLVSVPSGGDRIADGFGSFNRPLQASGLTTEIHTMTGVLLGSIHIIPLQKGTDRFAGALVLMLPNDGGSAVSQMEKMVGHFVNPSKIDKKKVQEVLLSWIRHGEAKISFTNKMTARQIS